jgi:pentatricopeptide repeat protein
MYEELQLMGLEPSVFTYNALIRGHSLSGNRDQAFSVFKKMMVVGCSPNRETYAQLPNKC